MLLYRLDLKNIRKNIGKPQLNYFVWQTNYNLVFRKYIFEKDFVC